MNDAAISRRFFIKATATAGGGLLLACTLPFDGLLGEAQAETLLDRPATALNAWLRISPDNQLTLICSQSEMGQGIMTTLPAVLAEELGADWTRVKVEISPAAPTYRNPRLKWQFTGNSESTTTFFELMRHMGAAARDMLIAAAAQRWRVPAAECTTAAAHVVHRPTKRRLTFGALAEEAARQTPPEKPRLTPPNEWKLLGKSLPRVEVPAKLNGTAIFGLDFMTPNMVYAAVKQSPVFGGKVLSFDKASVAGLSGIIDVVAIPNGVAVVADSFWRANQALGQLKVVFDEGPNAGMSSDSLMQQYRSAMNGTTWKNVRADGEFVEDANLLQQPGRFPETFTAEYESQFLAHATMEPMNCTAYITPEECRIWGPM